MDAMCTGVDFSACQATAGATSVERSCSRGPDESVYYPYPGCGGAGPVAGGPRGVLFNDIAPRSFWTSFWYTNQNSWQERG